MQEQQDSGTEARRRCADGGHEVAGWLGPAGARVFRVLHLPPTEPIASLLVCGPVGGESDGNYRRQTLLARALATRGFVVSRFQYRGTSNSDGERSMTSYQTMVDDALAAAAELAALAPRAVPNVLGVRLGAIVAANVATPTAAQRLVLWHPVLDAATYRRELGRAARLQQVADGRVTDAPGAARAFAESLASGVADLQGWSVHASLFDSFEDQPLDAATPDVECGVHLIQFGRRDLDPRYAAVLDRWETRGVAVESTVLPEPDLWWFAPGPWKRSEETRPQTVQAIDATLSILDRALAVAS